MKIKYSLRMGVSAIKVEIFEGPALYIKTADESELKSWDEKGIKDAIMEADTLQDAIDSMAYWGATAEIC